MVTVASTMPFAPGRKMAFTKRNAVKTVENTHNACSQPPLAALGIGDDNVFVACRNSTLPFQIRVSSVSVSIAALLHAIDDFPQDLCTSLRDLRSDRKLLIIFRNILHCN